MGNVIQVRVSDELLMRQEALVQRQGGIVRDLVTLESRQTSLTASLEGATGKERDDVTAQLRTVRREIAGLNADLADVRTKLGQTTIEVPAPPTIVEVPRPPFGEPIEMVPPPFGDHDEMMFGLTTAEFAGAAGFLLLFPLVLAMARGMWRRGSMHGAPPDTDSTVRLARLEQAVESVAIEVERIGESQRYTARLLSERQPEFNPATAGESARPAGDVRR